MQAIIALQEAISGLDKNITIASGGILIITVDSFCYIRFIN